MKRRDFLTKGTLAAGVASSPGLLTPILASETGSTESTQTSQQVARAPEEIRSAEYLRRAREDKFLPKMPAYTDTYLSGVKIVPMALEERLRRGVVPQRGFSSITPGSDALLISGNGPINIDMMCDPYAEQISFHHESLFMPHKPFAAPHIAGILPQVRQMLLDGKYHEAAKFAYEEWHKSPINSAGGGFGGGLGFLMRLDFPKTASVRDYLRTVDFESTELKVHWTDERGEWVRRTFTSRPDNVVVQWLTAPKGQSVNVRIALQRSAAGMRGGLGGFGGGGGQSGGQGEFHQDFNEQWLIFKGVLDPSVNNSGYAGVTRVVRDGGSARMDGDTLVVENASSVMLLTRMSISPTTARSRWKRCGRQWRGLPRTIRRCWSGRGRSSLRCSTASPWISEAPRNMPCLPRSFWPISGRAPAIRALTSRSYSKCAATGSS
jgi:hypothetical protein